MRWLRGGDALPCLVDLPRWAWTNARCAIASRLIVGWESKVVCADATE
jgi:hypothetical protein